MNSNYENVTKFLRTIQPPFEGILGEIQREALEAGIPIIPHETARYLSFLLSLIKPNHVLEIGTAVGFSAGLICRHLQEGGTLTTIDRYPIMINQAKKNIQKMGLTQKITLLEDDAANILPTLVDQYDFIFLDAAKGQYISFLPDLIRLLKIGGVLAADDVLQDGDVAGSRYTVPRRQRTIHKRLRNFLWEITHSPILDTAIIPIGAGLAVCTKTAEGGIIL